MKRQSTDVAAVDVASMAYHQLGETARACECKLLARALGLTRNAADARDLVQRALEKGLRSLHLFQAGSNMYCWLMRILSNTFIDDCRAAAAAPKMQSLDQRTDQGMAPFRSVAAAPPEPEADWARITPEQLRAALEELAPVFRDVYRMRIVDKLGYADIARRLDIPIGTVATRLARARGRLHEVLARELAAEAAGAEDGR
jgi:RNA polymerase sigma-70 factor (ECF subfamily)